jgi:hypothetical protein
MENTLVLAGETIPLTTQLAFGADGNKWREEEERWDYDNSVRIIKILKRRTAQDICLLGLELWWVKIHLKSKFRSWGQFLEDVGMNYSSASRFKRFAQTYMATKGIMSGVTPTKREVLTAIKELNADLAMLQHLDMREFWGVKSNTLIITGPAENRNIWGFSFGKIFKQIWQHWAEWTPEERLAVVETLKLWVEMFQTLIADLEIRGQPMLVEEERARLTFLIQELKKRRNGHDDESSDNLIKKLKVK